MYRRKKGKDLDLLSPLATVSIANLKIASRTADYRLVTATSEGQSLRSRALNALGKLPPFSPILNRLLASLANDEVSFGQIADLIEKDTVLAGNVLRLVNSALYSRGSTIHSVRHAVSILGINRLRNGILGMSVMRIWNQVRTPAGWSMARFNLHSVGTALMADLLSQAGPVEYPEGAFAGGLFHDVGRLLILIGLPEEHDQISRLGTSRYFSQSECEHEVLQFTHADLSADVLFLWKLPEKICTAVRYHDSPELTPPHEGQISLSRVIALADDYVNAAGYTVDRPGDWPVVHPEIDDVVRELEEGGFESPIPPLLETFATEFETMRTLF